jgi:hypothetical protein
MRYDESKSFPHPVLRPGSRDYVDSAFQATVRWGLSKDTQTITIEAFCQLSEPGIKDLVQRGQATFAILLESRETYFRDLITSSDPGIQQQYDGGRVKGRVELLPFIVTTEVVQGFRSGFFNPEYGPRFFDLSPGDVLALDTPRDFFVGQEVFASISSVFQLVEEDEVQTGEIRLDLDNELIQIRVSPKQKELLDNAREQRELRPLLLNAIYLPTLMQVLAYISKEPDEFADRKWFRSIKAKCDMVEITINDGIDLLAVAQELLKYPILTLNKNYFSGE